MSSTGKKVACFVLGTLFGSVGIKLLSSKDARKCYTHVAAAGLRMKDAAMETVSKVQENVEDIMADARDLNAARAAEEAAAAQEIVEDASEETAAEEAQD